LVENFLSFGFAGGVKVADLSLVRAGINQDLNAWNDEARLAESFRYWPDGGALRIVADMDEDARVDAGLWIGTDGVIDSFLGLLGIRCKESGCHGAAEFFCIGFLLLQVRDLILKLGLLRSQLIQLRVQLRFLLDQSRNVRGQSDGNYCSHDGEHYLKLDEEWERGPFR